ncbi:MAG: hypothetical protein ACTHOE_04365 [Conexibacter sp.]
MNGTDRLDLTVPRTPGQLLAGAVMLFGRHSGLFLSLTLIIVAPVVILVDGVWRNGLGGQVTVTATTAVVATLLELLMPVLVTALHVAVVRSLGEGRLPDVREVLHTAGPRFPAAVGASIFYAGIVVVGFIVLLLPGIWLVVAGYFGAQIAVVERTGPFDAVMRSVELVRGHWWRTAGLLLCGWVVFALVFLPVDAAVGTLHPGVLYVTLLVLARAFDLSLTALYGTLAYFSVRAWKAADRPTPTAV